MKTFSITIHTTESRCFLPSAFILQWVHSKKKKKSLYDEPMELFFRLILQFSTIYAQRAVLTYLVLFLQQSFRFWFTFATALLFLIFKYIRVKMHS